SSIDLSSSDDLNEILNEDSISQIDSYDKKWQDSPYNIDYENLKICKNSDLNSTDANFSSYGYASADSNQIIDTNTVYPGNYNDKKLEDLLPNNILEISMSDGIRNFDESEVSGACLPLNKTEYVHNSNGTSNGDEDTKGIDYLLTKGRINNFSPRPNMRYTKKDWVQKLLARNMTSSHYTPTIFERIKARFKELFTLLHLGDRKLDYNYLKPSLKDGINKYDFENLIYKRVGKILFISIIGVFGYSDEDFLTAINVTWFLMCRFFNINYPNTAFVAN
ncbi:MAG: hypothetical protein MHMPM18_002463, partial [Marteilia pararefringens]